MPEIGNFGLIDLETPDDAYTKTSNRDGSEWQLVFSDEFNTDGRTFYPGDDPYWEVCLPITRCNPSFSTSEPGRQSTLLGNKI